MGMNLGSAAGADAEPMVDINTTPLIDVMLVLLIMLIITIPIQLHSVKMNMPDGQPPPVQTAPPEVVRLDIGADGVALWNGEALPDRPALEAKLAALSQQADPPEVHVRPDRAVAYKFVAAVLASAQKLGVTKIGIVGNEQFM